MDPAVPRLVERTRKLVRVQVVIGALVTVTYSLAQGGWDAMSAAYGCLISIALALLLGLGVARAGSAVQEHPKKGAVILLAGAATRFLLALILFGLGLAIFKLTPLAMVIGFALTQIGYAISNGRDQKPKC